MANKVNFHTTLETLCKATTSDVWGILKVLGFTVVDHKRPKGYNPLGRPGRRYAYRQGASPDAPLVVCHADTVAAGGDKGHTVTIDKKSNKAFSIALDDRLGIACMVYAIRTNGWLAKCSMLVCDEEEVGGSTAAEFTFDRGVHGLKPNWLVELDRRGNDAVTYEYGTPLLDGMLKGCGFRIGNGSFSDICYMTELGVIGFNVAIGYDREHSANCNADLNVTASQLAKLHTFYKRFYDLRLVHDIATRSYSGYGNYDSYSDYEAVDDWSGYVEPDCDLTAAYGDYMSIDQVIEVLGAEDFFNFTGWMGGKNHSSFFTCDVEDFITHMGYDLDKLMN